MMIVLFVSSRVGGLDDRAVSIRQIIHIKSLFIGIFNQILNLKYSRHLRITNCVSLKSFFLLLT